MKIFRHSIARFAADEFGASATEYAILVAVIAGLALAAIRIFELNNVFNVSSLKVNNCVNAAASGTDGC